MKLNDLMKRFGRLIATAMICVSAFTFVWQASFISNTTALAAPNNLIATSDAGDAVKSKTSEDAGRAKGFIRDTADKVEETAFRITYRTEAVISMEIGFI